MDASGAIMKKAIRWDTSENRIFFDIQQRTMDGMLVLTRSADGRIDMRFKKGSMSAVDMAIRADSVDQSSKL